MVSQSAGFSEGDAEARQGAEDGGGAAAASCHRLSSPPSTPQPRLQDVRVFVSRDYSKGLYPRFTTEQMPRALNGWVGGWVRVGVQGKSRGQFSPLTPHALLSSAAD